MSYYNYLRKYSPGFLRKYQADTYANLSRTTRYSDIVQMNATSTLTVDEDITFKYKIPYNLANVSAFLALAYWYFYHVECFSANHYRKRLRSYHNYRMWTRLEFIIRKQQVQNAAVSVNEMDQMYFAHYGITKEQFEEVYEAKEAGEDVEEALANIGLKWNPYKKVFDKIQYK